MLHTMSEPVTSAGSPMETGSRSGTAPTAPGLVDQHQVRRVGGPGEIAREIGQPDADEDHLAVAQLARGDGCHHLVRGIGGHR